MQSLQNKPHGSVQTKAQVLHLTLTGQSLIWALSISLNFHLAVQRRFCCRGGSSCPSSSPRHQLGWFRWWLKDHSGYPQEKGSSLSCPGSRIKKFTNPRLHPATTLHPLPNCSSSGSTRRSVRTRHRCGMSGSLDTKPQPARSLRASNLVRQPKGVHQVGLIRKPGRLGCWTR